MPESLDAFAEIAAIRDELEEHGHLIEAMLRSQPSLATDIYTAVAADPLLAEIVLTVDGKLTQSEIGDALRQRKVNGSSVGNISKKFDELHNDHHLITLVHQKKGKVYRRSRLAKVIGVERKLQRDTKRKKL